MDSNVDYQKVEKLVVELKNLQNQISRNPSIYNLSDAVIDALGQGIDVIPKPMLRVLVAIALTSASIVSAGLAIEEIVGGVVLPITLASFTSVDLAMSIFGEVLSVASNFALFFDKCSNLTPTRIDPPPVFPTHDARDAFDHVHPGGSGQGGGNNGGGTPSHVETPGRPQVTPVVTPPPIDVTNPPGSSTGGPGDDGGTGGIIGPMGPPP